VLKDHLIPRRDSRTRSISREQVFHFLDSEKLCTFWLLAPKLFDTEDRSKREVCSAHGAPSEDGVGQIVSLTCFMQ